MFKRQIVALSLIVGLPHFSAVAAQTATTNLNVTVIVTSPTCSVVVPPSIDMGIVSDRDFSSVGASANSKDFRLELTGCSGGVTGATVTFSGTAAASDTSSFALDPSDDPAKGIGLQIKDNQGTIFSPNQSSVSYAIDSSAPDISLPFEASFIQTENRIEAGTADTTVTVSITYS